MRFRMTTAVLLALLPSHAWAFDPAKANRYPSPDLYRPNVDQIKINGSGSTGDVSGMSTAAAGYSRLRSLSTRAAEDLRLPDIDAPSGTDWSAAFSVVEGAPPPRVSLPPGTYNAGRPAFQLNARYAGPGSATIVDSGGSFLPADFSWILQRPTVGTGTGYNKFFSADGRYSDRDYRVIYNGLRVGLDEPYYAPEMSKRLSIYDTRGGASGFIARLTQATSAGATQVTLNAVDGLTVGMQIAFSSGGDMGSASDRATITAINGTTITISPGLAQAHAVGDHIANGLRTMQSRGHYELRHAGGGDAYINLFRVTGAATALAGQDHVFETATAGIDGGDIFASTDGQYFTGREVTMGDNGHDVAYAAEVRSFLRNNNTGARGAFWIGDLYKSEGTKPADAGWVLAGRWNVGLDTTRADLSAFGQAAVNMAAGQGILWDSAPNSSELYPLWGKIKGETWTGIESGLWKLKRPNAGTQVDAIAVTDAGQVGQPQKPMVVAEASANITLTGAYTPLALPSVYDALGDYNATNGRFTCRAAGRYRIHVRALMDGSTGASTGVIATIFKNGGVAVGGDHYLILALGPQKSASAETILPCNAGDFFEVRAVDGNAPGGILHGGPATGFTIEYLG